MDTVRDRVDAVTEDQRAWLRHSEAVWRRAQQLAEAHPRHDVTDLYHALRFLELTPSERLSAGLSRARLRLQRA